MLAGRARDAVALVAVAALLTGCGGASEGTSSRADSAASPNATARPFDTGGAVAVRPAGDAAGLARQLNGVAAVLRDGDASAEQVQRAGELQQLAVRALVVADARFLRAVTARLRPGAKLLVRAGVRAGRQLRAMGSQERRLPPWRIIEPPAPQVLLTHYREAQRRFGVPWSYLAAIHLVETRMGRIRGRSTAGARGPMQFIPSTWDLHGAGGDINDPRDAILAAGRLLKAHGAPHHMSRALFHYNPSDRYVRAVSAYARNLKKTPWAYRGYWGWRVLYSHARGVYILPVGYPRVRPVKLDEE